MAAVRDVPRQVLPAVVFLAVVPALAHVLFSSLGFNPTDDGFTLAYSRRLLDGQVPHRDFIIIRPFLSPLLHVPIVRWGGDSTFLLSRYFVWLELAAIAWAWMYVVAKLLERRFTIVQRIALALISLAASAHTFPIMAWHTIDGLLLTVLGMACCVAREGSRLKPIGYLLMAMAYLCKQSFLPAPFLVLALLGDWRNAWCRWAVLVPGIAYAAFLVARGAVADGIVQLASQGDMVTPGLVHYLRREILAGVLLGALALWWIRRDPHRPATSRTGLLVVSIAPALVIALALPSAGLSAALSYGLFGMVAAHAVIWLLQGRTVHSDRLRLASLALIVAWSASLSIGFHVPTLGSGALLMVLFGYACTMAPAGEAFARARTPLVAALAVVALASFGAARTEHVYREGPAATLAFPLDSVLPGGHHIRTNLNTYLYLSDLHSAVLRARHFGEAYTILPGCAGWWVKARRSNPLSIDWAQPTELRRPELVDRAVAELELGRDHNVVIVQKAEAEALAGGFTPLKDQYAVVRYVKRHFHKVDETPLFELYR